MRILVSGGIKTHNIVDGISKKFTSSGDDFVEVQFLDDILNIFSLGDYFDKALITEQSITRDKQIKDEMEIRQRVNKFAIEISKKPHKYNYVFLASDENMAQMIYDEILPIFDDSAVVLKEPPYKTTFFIDIIVTEAKDLPSEWVFEPDLDIPIADTEIDGLGIDESVFDGMDESENAFQPLPTEDDFGSNMDIDNDSNGGFGMGFDINEGETISSDMIPENTDTEQFDENIESTEDLFGDASDFENNFENDIQNDIDNEATQVNSGGGGVSLSKNTNEDEFVDTDGFEAVEQTEDLPNYGTVQQDNNGFIPGFDDVDGFEENEQTNDTQIAEMDEPYENNQDTEFYPQEQDKADDTSFQDQGEVFDNSMYGNQDFDSNMYENSGENEQINDESNGFSDSMYNNTGNEDEYHDSVNNGIYEDTPQGFNNGNFADGMITGAALGAMAGAGMAQGNGQKKGFFSKMLNKNSQAQQNTQGPVGPMGNVGPMGPIEQQPVPQQNIGRSKINVKAIKEGLRPFASRGNSIVVTGCGGCGTSFIAYSLANIINQLGYTVLLVDMDTLGRTQSYITKSNYESMEVEDAKLMAAINSSNNASSYETIVKQGFHLLTMGMGTDTAPVKDILHKEKLSRFVNVSKSSHNFVIYDIPFADATNFLADITYTADNLVLVSDASNWGIAKTMLSVCNISIEDMQDTVFNRAQLVFNRYRNLTKLFGKKVRTGNDITKVMDSKVQELIGEDPGFHFEDMIIAGIINDDPSIENGWFEDVTYTDTKKGQEVFLELVEHIILKK